MTSRSKREHSLLYQWAFSFGRWLQRINMITPAERDAAFKNTYLKLNAIVAVIGAIAAFVASWGSLVYSYGVVGLGLGWIPATFIAVMAYFASMVALALSIVVACAWVVYTYW